VRGGADGGGCFPTGRHYPGIAHLLRVAAVGLADEFDGDHATRELSLVSIDTETTGKDSEVDRLVEIACVYYRDGTVAGHQSWLVNPGQPIPEEAHQIHGISDQDVADQPRFEQVAAEVVEALRGCVPVAYNADFDRGFLMSEFARVATPPGRPPPALRKEVIWIDPLVWARELQKEARGKSLVEVCARLGIEIGQAHRATDDAAAALQVLLRFEQDPRMPATYAALLQEQQRLARAFEERRRWRQRARQ
jgi:DNA polymerase-3 subunit epsilon